MNPPVQPAVEEGHNMPLIKQFDNSLEKAVKAIISKNYPEIAFSGMINDVTDNAAATSAVVTGYEGSGDNPKELFSWGTSMWGSKQVVAR